jgi:hypothetical protein
VCGDPDRIARAWAELMERLGYKHYMAQGRGSGFGSRGRDGATEAAGTAGYPNVKMPATVPADVAKALNDGDPAPAGLSDKEKAAFASLDTFYKKNCGYAAMML